jgi:stress response protein SCP2
MSYSTTTTTPTPGGGYRTEVRTTIITWEPTSTTSVSLKRGVALEFSTLSQVYLGLGWDKGEGKTIDLDASLLPFERSGKCHKVVYFNNMDSEDGAIHLLKDNLSGEGEGDDEQVNINLRAVAPEITELVCVVTIYSEPYTFADVKNAFVRMVDATNQREVCRYSLDSLGSETALIFAKIIREGTSWRIQAIGEPAKGRRGPELVENVAANFLETGRGDRDHQPLPPPPPRALVGESPLRKRKSHSETAINIPLRCFLCGIGVSDQLFTGDATLTSRKDLYLSCDRCYNRIKSHKNDFVSMFRDLETY